LDRPTQTALIAIGGNSLVREGEQCTIPEQLANARQTAQAIVQVIQAGFRVVVTHGNGPQVGAAMLRSERSADQIYPHPLDVCDATTQGEIGYLLQQSLQAALSEASLPVPVATVVTQVVVSATDPAMTHPTKPIGPFYTPDEAAAKRRQSGWTLVEENGRGHRRVVPSPEPLEVVEEAVIRHLSEAGVLVIAAGGGGIPVVRHHHEYRGVEAVIDKDATSALLAARLGSDCLAIAMDLDRVYLNYRTPDQRPLDRVTAAEVERYDREGHFPPGTMGPKIHAALRFLRSGGREVIITSFDHLAGALLGQGGTHIVSS
jgi:carbamate kinase